MGLEQTGIQAIWDNKLFQQGVRQYQQGLKQTESATDSTASVLSRLGAVASGAVFVGLGAATAAIGGFIAAAKIGLDATTKWGESLDKMGDMFGMTGEQASGWAFFMKKYGVSVEEGAQQLNYFTKQLDEVKKAGGGSTVELKDNSKAVNKLKEQLADANVQLQRAQHNLASAKKPTDQMKWAVDDAQKKVNRLNAELASTPATLTKVKQASEKLTPFQEALKKLGVSAFDAKGKLKSFDQIMPDIMDKFAKLPAGVNATALAMDLFGARGGSKFLDLLRQGSGGLADATQKAKELGLTLDTDTVNAIEGLGFAQNELNLGLEAFKNQIGLAVLPIAKDLVDYVNKNIIPAFVAWAKEHAPAITTALRGIGDWITTTGLPTFKQFVSWVQTNWPTIQKTITDAWTKQIQPALVAFKGWLESDGVKALQTFFAEMEKFKPIAQEWQQVWTDLRGVFGETTDAMGEDAGFTFPSLADIVSAAMGRIRSVSEDNLRLLRDAGKTWHALTIGDWTAFSYGLLDVITGIFNQLTQKVGISLYDIRDRWNAFAPQLRDAILGDLTSLADAMAGAAQSMMDGVIAGMWAKADQIRQTLWDIVQAAIQALRDSLGMHSPSRVMAGIGANMAAGLAAGFGTPQLNFGMAGAMGGMGASLSSPVSTASYSTYHSTTSMKFGNINFNGVSAPATPAQANRSASMFLDALRAKGVDV